MKPTKPYSLIATQKPCQGTSIVEYCLLLSLVGLLCTMGLAVMGTSTSNLFVTTADTLLNLDINKILSKADQNSASIAISNKTASGTNGNTPTLATEQLSPSTLSLKGSGYYSLVRSPRTGRPKLKLVNNPQSATTNVSSIDGSRMNTLGTIMIANSLAKMAEQETNPELKKYYTRLAELSFYMGGAEGEIDQVPGLEIGTESNGGTYSKGDALRDIYQYHNEMKQLMQNPPAYLDQKAFLSVMPMATTVYNIGQNYLNHFDQFIDSTGNVTQNFGNPARCDSKNACPIGTGTPGSGLAQSKQVTTAGVALINKPYHELVSLTTVKDISNNLLTTHQVASAPVKSTLINATKIDKTPIAILSDSPTTQAASP